MTPGWPSWLANLLEGKYSESLVGWKRPWSFGLFGVFKGLFRAQGDFRRRCTY